MKSRVISKEKAKQITLAILLKANEENIKSVHASYMEVSDALLPLHIKGMKRLQTSHLSVTGYNYIQKHDTKVDERLSYRDVATKIIPYEWRWDSNVLDMFHGKERYYHYHEHPNPKFVYRAPCRTLCSDTENELYPLYESWVTEHEGMTDSMFDLRVLAPIGGGKLYCTPEFMVELVPVLEQWKALHDRMSELYTANKNLADDLHRNINRARTTKNICRDWPEIAGFVARLYGEEEAEQEMEVPLGNIISRHHPHLLGAPA